MNRLVKESQTDHKEISNNDTSNHYVTTNIHMAFLNKNNSNANVHESVVNLSQRPLSIHETKLLSKGMRFCPTPGEPNMRDLHRDLDQYHLQLKRYLHFNKLLSLITLQKKPFSYANLCQATVPFNIPNSKKTGYHRQC